MRRKNQWCAVAMCSNTAKNSAKIFINIPADPKRRKLWLELGRRNPKDYSAKSVLFMCEDHFELEKDMENYMKYKMTGCVKRMKKNAVPSKFDCQKDRKITHRKPERSLVRKRRNIEILKELNLAPTSGIKYARVSAAKNYKLTVAEEKNTSYGISDKTLECESAGNGHDINNFSMLFTFKQEVIQSEETANVSQTDNINIKQEIEFFPESSPWSEHPLNINNSSIPRSNIKPEITEIKDETTNLSQEGNINAELPMPIIKQEIEYLAQSPASPEYPLEPICFVSTTENIAEDFNYVPTESDQHDIFGKFVASDKLKF